MMHQTVVNNLTGIFYINSKNKPCSVFPALFDVRLPISSAKKDSAVVQPDLCIICDESKLDEKGCKATPDLMVEILLPKNSKHEVHTKFNVYQEAGVKEYWIINPSEKIILVYTLIDDLFIGLRPQVEREKIKSMMFPDIDIAVQDVFCNV
jgi:Uma2 family endonuclease